MTRPAPQPVGEPRPIDSAEAVRLYDEEQMTILQVAEELGAPYGAVRRVLKKSTTVRPQGGGRRVTEEEVLWIVRLHAEGWSARAIVIEFGKSASRARPPRGASEAKRRELGAELRRRRKAAGFSLDDAARILECDRSKISRIETGARGVRPKEMRELLAAYGAEEMTAER